MEGQEETTKITLPGNGEIEVNSGQVRITGESELPDSTMRENVKYPFTQWNIEQLEKQMAKDFQRLVKTAANYVFVSGLVASREENKDAEATRREVEKLRSKLKEAEDRLAKQHAAGGAPRPEAS